MISVRDWQRKLWPPSSLIIDHIGAIRSLELLEKDSDLSAVRGVERVEQEGLGRHGVCLRDELCEAVV